MRSLTVLGSCGAWPEPGRACAGFLLEYDGFKVVLDLGYAALPQLPVSVAEARQVFSGQVIAAEEGLVLSL